jgi:hypothetical protein
VTFSGTDDLKKNILEGPTLSYAFQAQIAAVTFCRMTVTLADGKGYKRFSLDQRWILTSLFSTGLIPLGGSCRLVRGVRYRTLKYGKKPALSHPRFDTVLILTIVSFSIKMLTQQRAASESVGMARL